MLVESWISTGGTGLLFPEELFLPAKNVIKIKVNRINIYRRCLFFKKKLKNLGTAILCLCQFQFKLKLCENMT